MKSLRLILFVVFCILTQNLFSQTATSIANGPWLSPFTWNCTCVPLPGYTVTINHHVTLNTSFQLPSGGITVNVGGSLVQDTVPRDILMNGGFIINHGTVDFRYLLLQSGSVNNTDTLRLKSFANYGLIDNSGVLHRVDSFYNVGFIHNSGFVSTKKFQNSDTLINDGVFTDVDSFYNMSFLLNNDSIITPTFFTGGTLINNGNIAGVDSFTNTGMLRNNTNGIIYADSMLNSGTLINQGTIHTTAFASIGNIQNEGLLTFADAYNINQFTNSDSLVGAHSLLNTGRFINAIGGNILLGGSFLNVDSLQHDASFFNNGIMVVDSDWYNSDTVSGVFGNFTVAFESGNSGRMLGSFDFCDLTPPSVAPFIDNNSGTISPQITWCTPQAPDAIFTAADVCIGEPVVFINNSTGTITNFYWDFDDGASSTQTNPTNTYGNSGTYHVMLVAANALILDTGYLNIMVYPLPATPTVTISGNTISCSVTATNYTWYLDGILQSGITTQSFVATQQGYYSVKIADVHGCSSEKSDSVFANVIAGIVELQNENAVYIFPNPFSEESTLNFFSNETYVAALSAYNLIGQQVFSNHIRIASGKVNTIPINLANNTAGVYIYKLQLGNKLYCGKVVKE